MLNKFGNFHFTNINKGMALLYGLGVYRGYKGYDIPQDNKRYYHIGRMWTAILVGFAYVCPPYCIFMWHKDLRIIEDYIRDYIKNRKIK